MAAVGVALLAEGVDRNSLTWALEQYQQVALLAEGVDRNYARSGKPHNRLGRPPRGGRG